MKFDGQMLASIAKAKQIAVFTGAGVSQESGIPTFRDALTGLWENFAAEDLATKRAFVQNPELVWGWYEWRRSRVLQAQPNQAHLAIAALEAFVPSVTVITQNVDDLHERAGSMDVIHLHGSLHHPRCIQCGKPHTLETGISDGPDGGRHIPPPLCTHCEGRVRPGVVWFGEDLPINEWGRAQRLARACDVLFCIGTSSIVMPAASIPRIARENRACVIQINPTPTSHDHQASYVLRGTACEVLSELRETMGW